MLKQFTEAVLEASLDSHVADDNDVPRRGNDKSSYRVKNSEVKIVLTSPPRDHTGAFEAQIIRKNQISVGDDIWLQDQKDDKPLKFYDIYVAPYNFTV